jgi:integrase/recombinase XerD
VTALDLEQYRLLLVEKPYAAPTQELYLRCVRDFFRHLERTQRLFANPAADIVIHKPGRALQPVPTEADVRKLLAQPDTTTPAGVRDRAYLEMFYSTGIRLEELVGLDLADPILKQGRLRVFGKGRKERVVPLGKHALAWLRQYLKDVRPAFQKDPDEQALWIGPRAGRRMQAVQIQQDLQRYSRQARLAISISPHALRRACATHMLRNGAHPVQIQMLLGHVTLHNLSQYLRVTVTDMAKMHRRSKPGQ